MDYIEQAVSLAKLALGQASPNPAVGAVLVKDDTVVGQGYTQPPGSSTPAGHEPSALLYRTI